MIDEQQFRSLLAEVGIRDGDVLYVSSSLAPFYDWKDAPHKVFEILKDTVGKSGTIVVPTFNFDFCQGVDFDVENTVSKTGVLSEWIRKQPGVIRSWAPPYHSVAAYGKYASDIVNKFSPTSFGENSAFSTMLMLDAKQLCLGCTFHDGVVHIHALEEKLKVPYRYWKKFDGNIISGGGKHHESFFMYARNEHMNPVINTGQIESRLNATGIVVSAEAGLCRVECFRLSELYGTVIPWMQEDPWILVENKPLIDKKFNLSRNGISSIDHIGVVSKYSDAIKQVLNSLGILLSESGIVEELGVRCEYYNLNDIRIEFVEPVTEDSRLMPYYTKHSSHPIHHIAFRVDSLEVAMKHAMDNGCYPLDNHVYSGPRLGEKVTFLSPLQAGGILIEFVEIPSYVYE